MAFKKSINEELNVLAGPACRHLRSKGMYVTGQMNPAADDPYGMGDGNCWCNRTADAMGPDQKLADRCECNSTRACYEPLL